MIVCKPGTTSKYPKGLTELSTRHLRKPTTAFPACGPQYQQPASPLCKIQSPKASLYSAASSSLQQHSRFNPASDAAHPGHTQACRAAFQSSAVSSPRHQRLMMQSHASGQTMVLSDSDPLQGETAPMLCTCYTCVVCIFSFIPCAMHCLLTTALPFSILSASFKICPCTFTQH